LGYAMASSMECSFTICQCVIAASCCQGGGAAAGRRPVATKLAPPCRQTQRCFRCVVRYATAAATTCGCRTSSGALACRPGPQCSHPGAACRGPVSDETVALPVTKRCACNELDPNFAMQFGALKGKCSNGIYNRLVSLADEIPSPAMMLVHRHRHTLHWLIHLLTASLSSLDASTH
jgi:hypothetical protein